MAISPPSDILLDVAGAADPSQVRAATARLAALAADPGAANVGFSQALAQAKDAGAAGASASAGNPRSASWDTAAPITAAQGSGTRPLDATSASNPYKQYEAVMLQSFIEAMLPKDDEVFGDKESAGVYRSMMAEQLAKQMADNGGIGLAKAMEAAHPALPHHPPAFSVPSTT